VRRATNPGLWRRSIPAGWQALNGKSIESNAHFDDLYEVDVIAKASRHDQIPIAESTGGSVQ
jgi:hypothetical protein